MSRVFAKIHRAFRARFRSVCSVCAVRCAPDSGAAQWSGTNPISACWYPGCLQISRAAAIACSISRKAISALLFPVSFRSAVRDAGSLVYYGVA